MNNRPSEDFFRLLCISHFIVTFVVQEGVGDRTELQYIDPHSYGRQRCVFLILLINQRPGFLLTFFTASYQQLLWIPRAPSTGLPLPHLIF